MNSVRLERPIQLETLYSIRDIVTFVEYWKDLCPITNLLTLGRSNQLIIYPLYYQLQDSSHS